MQQERPTSRNVRAAGLALAGALLALPGAALANSTGPPDERTGAPEEMTCRISGCHVDELLNSGPGVLELILPPSYVPAETYTIDVRLSQTGQMRWGFELTVLDALGEGVGSLASTDGQTQVSASGLPGREYVKHTLLGTAASQADGHAWSFSWTAPSGDVGPVTFYAAGNAADNNNFPFRRGTADSGDFIYTEQQTVPVPEADGLPAALGALASIVLLGRPRRRRR